MSSRLTAVLVLAIGVVSVTGSVAAAGWPKIPQAEKTLSAVPDNPNAPAVILLREGRVHIDETGRSSYIEIYTRIKILTDEGTRYGTISLFSSDFMRTKDIAGRTHLPDGKVVDLADNATFEKEFSDYYDTSVTSCALPEVVPGAIVEYRYRVFFDSVFYPRTWYFQAEIPTLLNTVTYELPTSINFYPVEFNTLNYVKLDRETKRNARGGVVTYTMRNLPPVPDEPHRFPFADLSSRVVVLPGVSYSTGIKIHLYDSWTSLIEVVEGNDDYGYVWFRKNAGESKRTAKHMIGATHPEKAEAIYRWVRDEIALEPYVGIFVGDRQADVVLKNRRGDYAEKSLLLQLMLDAAGIRAYPGWVNPRHHGRVLPDVPNPRQFDQMLVVADLGNELVFLDPSDTSLAFGALPPDLQGVPCLVVRSKKDFEWLDTPQLDATRSARKANVELKVTDDGAVQGTGTLKLTGSHAWRRLEWRDTEDETTTAWREWIEDQYSGYDITDVTVVEDIPATTVDVAWKMAQRPEEVLGDEAVINPAAPLAVTTNPFTLEPPQRATPVQLSFPDLDEVAVSVSWPETWEVDIEPAARAFSNEAGSVVSSAVIDPELRTATLNRSMTISRTDFIGPEPYAAIRNLYREAVKNDAESLVLLAE
jgi:hypothetical protein